MARSFNGSSQYVDLVFSSAPDYPITFACWAYPTSDTVAIYAFGASGTGGSNIGDFLGLQGANPGDGVNLRCGQGGSTVGVDTTVGFTANAWNHVCGIVETTTDRRIYLNGGNMQQSTTSLAHQAMDTVTEGCFRNQAARSSYMPGRIAHMAIWTVALTADEIAALGKGFSPRRIRPQSLKFYDPGLGSPRSLRDGISSVSDNSGGLADHGRSYGL